MQTFLPYKDFQKTFEVLDYRRLGKQRVEAMQILNILLNRTERPGWRNHPIVRMWEGYEPAIQLYHNMCIDEWIKQGGSALKHNAQKAVADMQSKGFDPRKAKPGSAAARIVKAADFPEFPLPGDKQKVTTVKPKRSKVGKIISTIKKALSKEEYEIFLNNINEASARADAKRAMRSDPSMKQNPFLTDVEASDEDIKGASKNIIMQTIHSMGI